MKAVLLVLSLSTVCVGVFDANPAMAEPLDAQVHADPSEPSEAAFARKDRSEAVLRAQGVEVDTDLPPIVDARQALPRSHEEVVHRALAIVCTAVKGQGASAETVDFLIERFGVGDRLSPREREFIETANPSTFERIEFAWRYEAAWTLLWAISLVDDLGPPREIVNLEELGTLLSGETASSLIRKTSLRPLDEVLDKADLFFRYHRVLSDARSSARDLPGDLDPGVATERYRAFAWLIGDLGRNWDEIAPGP